MNQFHGEKYEQKSDRQLECRKKKADMLVSQSTLLILKNYHLHII